MRGTPLPSWTFIAAQVLRAIVLVAAMTIVLFAIGWLAFDVDLTGRGVLGLVCYVALGTAVFSAVLLGFISGVWIPVHTLPDWLEEVGRVFPLAHLAEGLQRTVAEPSVGTGLTGENVAVLAAWGIAGLVVAARGFRWEPQARRG